MMVRRTGYFYLALMMAFTALLFRIFWLSIGENAALAREAVDHRDSSVILYRTKGIIYDASLRPIAGNQPCTYLVINPREFQRDQVEALVEISGEPKERLLQKLKKETPFVIKSRSGSIKQTEGIFIYEGVERYSGIASHLLGYLDGENKVGLSGVEREFGDYLDLFSASVSVQYHADALNGMIAQEGMEEQKGKLSENGLVLTLEKELCKTLEESMDRHLKKGAGVVMDCHSGEIKALCSRPNYEEEKIADYLESTEGELINRALSSQTVGSVFKIILAACALEKGLENFSYTCNGGILISNQTIACHNHEGHGLIGLKEAFSQSCNAYFIALGQMMGYDTIQEMASRFGFGEQIEILGSMRASAGVFPKESKGLALANLSIGQGDLMASPLQIARMTSVIANKGVLPRINVYKGLYLNGNLKEIEATNSEGRQILLEEIAAKLQEYCIETVENGTGKGAKPSNGGAGGKTSSAQTGIIENNEEQLNVYFTGFYPATNPRYVITIFAEDGVSGGRTCGPVFREICDFIAENCLTE